jgi:hypothetical protein
MTCADLGGYGKGEKRFERTFCKELESERARELRKVR